MLSDLGMDAEQVAAIENADMAAQGYVNPYVPLATVNQANQVSKNAVSFEASSFLPGILAFDPNAQILDPVWLRSDCNCRGGQFVEVPGQPQNSYCLPPAVPTGKMFDIRTRGCVPISGFRAPILPTSAMCYWRGYNICLYGGITLGVIVLAMLLKGKKSSAAAPAQATVEKELGSGSIK